VPWLPVLAVLACVWLMLNLPVETWLRFIIWMVIGFVIYFVYGASHSRLGRSQEVEGHAFSRAPADRRRSLDRP
jgi:APA family basic amino acid/polyamine antiporter